jgi:hypothetical protein
MNRKEKTVSIRIRESDYDILIGLMAQLGSKSITDAMTECIHLAAATNK